MNKIGVINGQVNPPYLHILTSKNISGAHGFKFKIDKYFVKIRSVDTLSHLFKSFYGWIKHVRRSLALQSRVSWLPFTWNLGVVVFKYSGCAVVEEIGTTSAMVLRSRSTFRRRFVSDSGGRILKVSGPPHSSTETQRSTNQNGNVSISLTPYKLTLRGLNRLAFRECLSHVTAKILSSSLLFGLAELSKSQSCYLMIYCTLSYKITKFKLCMYILKNIIRLHFCVSSGHFKVWVRGVPLILIIWTSSTIRTFLNY